MNKYKITIKNFKDGSIIHEVVDNIESLSVEHDYGEATISINGKVIYDPALIENIGFYITKEN